MELRTGALMIGGDALFTSHSEQLAELAVRHGVPTFYNGREFAAAGGLIAYGSDIADTRQLYRLSSQWRKTCRSAGSACNKNAADHQFQGRQSARHHHPAACVRSRRRGDRIESFCCP